MPDREPVAIDTSPWIALLDDEADRAEHVQRLLERAERRELQVFVSTVTITEIVKPDAAARLLPEQDERTFNAYMDNPFVTLVSVDPIVAARARDLRRAIPGLKTPDALILATGLVAGSTTLYTYDDGLLRLDGHAAVADLRIEVPPVEHEVTMFEVMDGGAGGIAEAEAGE